MLKIQSDQVPYTEYEMQWIGDFNPKMINIAENSWEVFRTRELYLPVPVRPDQRFQTTPHIGEKM